MHTNGTTTIYQCSTPIIVALGGSIIHPDSIDSAFLKALKSFLFAFTRRGYRFVIVVGGGSLARTFQTSAAKVMRVTNEDKDWIGIHSTRLHAHLLRTILRDTAHPVVIDERRKLSRLTKPITIASGWRPGWSTDYVAAVLAHDFGAREFIVAGKPAHVYDKDPSKHKSARPLHRLGWREYRKLIPATWSPGSHAPVDPIASRFAHAKKLIAIIINGKNLNNFASLIRGKPFQGTIIR